MREHFDALFLFAQETQGRFVCRWSEAATNTLPTHSKVAVAAIRNLDGLQGADMLIDLLSSVDRLVEG